MNTYSNQWEVCDAARVIAEDLHKERRELSIEPLDIHDWYAERMYEAADREITYTQDNWDVVNLFRCDLEAYDVPRMSDIGDDIDSYMQSAAWHIWSQLIAEALDA